jgi:hypothetical protein
MDDLKRGKCKVGVVPADGLSYSTNENYFCSY